MSVDQCGCCAPVEAAGKKIKTLWYLTQLLSLLTELCALIVTIVLQGNTGEPTHLATPADMALQPRV